MSRRKNTDLTKAQKSALLAALLQQEGDKINHLQLNPHPVDDSPRPSRMTKRALLAQSYRKRRGDALLTLLTLAASPMGESR